MKKAFRCIAFLLIFISIYLFAIEPMNYQNTSVNSYLKKYQNADVLILGSSHAYCNLNAATMWKESGVAAACIGQGEQPISMTYHMLESVLQVATPQMVVIESYMVCTGTDTKYDTAPGQYGAAVLGFPMYVNLKSRIAAAKQIDVKYRMPYVVGMPNWTTNFTVDDILGRPNDQAGFQYMTFYKEDDRRVDRCHVTEETQEGELSAYTRQYLQQIIDLCQSKEIPVLFVVTPFQMDAQNVSCIKAAKRMVEDRGVAFIDMNGMVDTLQEDLEQEMLDWGHSFLTASDKNAKWLAQYLVAQYGIKDRRTQLEYEKWNDIYQYYCNVKLQAWHEMPLRECIRMAAFDDEWSYSVSCGNAVDALMSDEKDCAVLWNQIKIKQSNELAENEIEFEMRDADGQTYESIRFRCGEDGWSRVQ